MEKSITETKPRTPREKIWIGIIQQAFEDAFELGMGHNLSIAEISQARNWFYTRACADACDHVGTTRDHIVRLLQNLQYNYNTGKITKEQLRFGIRRLDKKI